MNGATHEPVIRWAWINMASDLWAQIIASRHPADREMQTFFRARKQLGANDRRFVAETVYAALRHRRMLEQAVRRSDGTVAPDEVIVGALLQTAGVEPDRIPLPAERVQRVRAGLREVQRALRALPYEERLGLQYGFPDWLVREVDATFGETTERLLASMNEPAPMTLRVNTLRTSREGLIARLKAEGHDARPTRFSPWGVTLARRANLFLSEAFREGWFEVQDEGSQLIAMLAAPRAGQCVVDGCAGGGGKTLHLAAMMENRGMLYALDTDTRRLEGIRPRLRRADVHNVRMHAIRGSSDPHVRRLRGKADVLLVDAPCSGTGVFRRNPDAAWKVSVPMVEELVGIQRTILDGYAGLVKPGGTLVYATCSLLERENAAQVRAFLSRHPSWQLVDARTRLPVVDKDMLVDSEGMMRLRPDVHGCDGFFAAVMVRSSDRAETRATDPGTPTDDASSGGAVAIQSGSGEPG